MIHCTPQVTGVSRLGMIEQRLVEQVVPAARQVHTLGVLLKGPMDQLVTQGEVRHVLILE